ncbi:MAG: hypothetical protein FWH00_01810 [Oscillospiraceae bacterium]|nr:hypothetical protein [Oscillospiraceae bacterium]
MPDFLLEQPAFSMPGVAFIYVFMPLSLFFYYIIPHRLRPAALLWITLAFLLLAQPRVVPVLVLCVLLDYLAVRMMERFDNRPAARKLWAGFAIAKNLTVIIFAGRLPGFGGMMLLGAAVYCVSSLDMVLTFYRREYPYERSIMRIGLHGLFFPRLYAGPVQPYREFAPQLAQIHFNLRSLTVGFGQFVQGGLKTALIGRQCGVLYLAVSGFPAHEITVLSLWSASALFAFCIYFTLSGFCDMAQGIGAMFGIFLPRNFYYPYQSRGAGDFFERFNMTVTAFLRRIVSCVPTAAEPLCLLLTGMLFGLWFGLRVNYLLWGVFLAVFVLLERWVFRRLLMITPTLICRIITFGAVLLSFALMAAPTAADGILHMRGMLGAAGYAPYNDMILHQLTTNWPVLLIAVFLSTNAVNLLVLAVHRSIPRVTDGILAAANMILLVLLTAVIY